MPSIRFTPIATAGGVCLTASFVKPKLIMFAKPNLTMPEDLKNIRDDFARFVRHTAQRYHYRQDQIVDLIDDLCNPSKF